MKLESFENAIQIELRLLRKVIIGVGTGFIIMFALVLFTKQNFYLNRSEFVKERPLGSSVCYDAFMSLIDHHPTSDYLTDEILKTLKSTDFNVSVDDVLAVQMIEENKCRLISKSGEKVRTFLIDLIGSKKNVHYYKLSEINEVEVSNSELTTMTKEHK